MGLLGESFKKGKEALKDLSDVVEMPESPRQKRQRFHEELKNKIGSERIEEIFSALAKENFSKVEELASEYNVRDDMSKLLTVFLDNEVDRGKELMKKIGKQLKEAEYSLQEANNVPSNDGSFPTYVETARSDFEAIEEGEIQKAQQYFETALHVAEHYGWHEDRFEREHQKAKDALQRVDEAEEDLERLESNL